MLIGAVFCNYLATNKVQNVVSERGGRNVDFYLSPHHQRSKPQKKRVENGQRTFQPHVCCYRLKKTPQNNKKKQKTMRFKRKSNCLLLLSVKVHETFQHNARKLSTASVRVIHRNTQSVGATGGVYKGQGRNQHELMTRAY